MQKRESRELYVMSSSAELGNFNLNTEGRRRGVSGLREVIWVRGEGGKI